MAHEVLISKTGGSGAIQPVAITSPERVVTYDMRQGYVYARFAAAIHKGESVEITLTSNIAKSFLGNPEWFEHQVLQETEKLTLETRFPNNRRCQAAEMIKVFGADENSIQSVVPDGNGIRVPVPSEMHIEAYRLSWNW